MSTTVILNERQLATTLAALRKWQSTGNSSILFQQIATEDGKFDPLSGNEIDSLCEQINVSDPALPPIEILTREPSYGEILVEYEVQEEVRYRRKMIIQADRVNDVDDLERLCEQNWIEHGHPIDDFVAVDERIIFEALVRDKKGKLVSAKVYFKSR